MDSNLEKKWKCLHCSSTFKYKGQMDLHLVTHDPNAKVKCEVCNRIFKNPPSLSSHVSHMHTNRIHPACNICVKPFSTRSHLRRHIDAVHNKKERSRLHCEFPGCEKTYLNKDAVSKHVKTEHAENPIRFPCSLCGKEFKSKGDLKYHIFTHTTEKPFKCATCGRAFSQKSSVTRHEMTHIQKSSRETFQCQLCLQTFINRRSFQTHIRVIHESRKNYTCQFCDKSFSSSTNLHFHLINLEGSRGGGTRHE